MADCWRFYARDPEAFRAWQAYYAAGRRGPEPAQPQWVKLVDTMPANARRDKVKNNAVRLAAQHGVVRALYNRHEIAVFKRYVVDKSPRDVTGAP